jgi:hypothetical protein
MEFLSSIGFSRRGKNSPRPRGSTAEPASPDSTRCAERARAGARGAGRWKRLPRGVRFVAIMLMLILAAGSLAGRAIRAVDLKAGFVFNFAHFVEWPARAPAGDELVIGVLGEYPELHTSLLEVTRGEAVRGQSLKVERYRHLGEMRTCQILFISQSESARLKSILAALQDRPILTVSDMERFTAQGGMVEFFQQGTKLRLRINLAATTAAGLKVSPKLLSLAHVVQAPEE